MEDQRRGDQEPVITTPTPLPFTDRSSEEESDVEEEEAEETERNQLDEDQKISDNSAPIHVCEHCSKEFSSGKALGGHKRIHFQSSKRDLRKKNKKSRKIQSQEGENDDVIHGCSICGKNFGSVKALYGHLRLHPDRPWRGSAANHQSSSSPLRYESSPNPNPSCPIEPKLGDLGKTQMVNLPNYPRITLSVDMSSWTTAAPAPSVSTSKEQDTAGILLLLACENPLNNEENTKKRRLIDPNEKKRKKLSELCHGNGADDEIRVSSCKEKKKVYICYPCNKSFSSHQAYGGHVSSHNKSGSKNHSSSSPTVDSTSRSEAGPSNESRLDPPIRRKVLDIDLNELPPPEEDEDEAQFRS